MKLNLLRPFLCLSLGSLVIFTSCMKLQGTEISEENDSNDFKNIVVPSGFNWNMSRSVSCDFTSTDNRLTLVNLSMEKDSEPFASLYVGAGAEKVKLTLPSVTKEVYARYATNSGDATTQDAVKLNIANDVISYNVPADAKEFIAAVKTRSANTKGQDLPLVHYPSTGWGTVMFEDLWPSYGDYDFNDVVLGYKIQLYPNNKNMVRDINIGVQVRCVGGTLPYDLFLRIKNLKGGEVDNVYILGSSPGVKVNALNDDNNVKEDAVIEIKNLKPKGYYNNLKTNGVKENELVIVNFAMELRNSVRIGDLEEASFDFFISYEDKSREIHLPGTSPVFNLQNYNTLAAGSSVTNKCKDFYYSNSGLVWAIKVPEKISHAIEKKAFHSAYPDFTKWIKSGGANYKDWYLNKVKEDLMPL